MNIAEILIAKYPTEWQLGKMGFKDENDGNGIIISHWDMPIPLPSKEQIMSYEPEVRTVHEINIFISSGQKQLEQYIDGVAQSKQYNNAISCVSYTNSNVIEWSAEAQAFIAWRDSVYSYAINQQQLMKLGQRSIPTFDEFKAELPVINW